MSCFVDTSALLSVLDADDAHHPVARDLWRGLLAEDYKLQTTSYVLVETAALLQKRFGLDALRLFQRDVYPLLNVYWVDSALHEAATAALITSGRRRLSLVDCVSFEYMRRRGITTCFAFDGHFAEQGFEVFRAP